MCQYIITMLYEIKLTVTKPNDRGEIAAVKEHYILDAELHGDAEKVGFDLYPNTDVDVTSVFRSDIREIINAKDDDNPFFKSTVSEVVIDEAGNEKESKFHVLVCAKDVSEATAVLNEWLKSALNDMRIDAVRRVKIADYIAYAGRP